MIQVKTSRESDWRDYEADTAFGQRIADVLMSFELAGTRPELTLTLHHNVWDRTYDETVSYRVKTDHEIDTTERPPSPFRVESAGVMQNGVLTLTAIRCDDCGDLIEAEDREAGITDLDRDAHYTDCSKRKRP